MANLSSYFQNRLPRPKRVFKEYTIEIVKPIEIKAIFLPLWEEDYQAYLPYVER
jgi:hypothetical protein